MGKTIRAFIRSLFNMSKQPPNPIQWKFTAKKTSFNTYSIHATALIAYPWRLFSQKSSPEGPLPTMVKFEENTYVLLMGDTKEVGTIKEDNQNVYKVMTHFYTSVVDFIQEVSVFNQPELLKGKIVYMACTDKQCLNPTEITFQIELS